MAIYKTYAEEFASLLIAACPQFDLGGLSEPPGLEQRRCFSFQVPCPSPSIKCPLVVDVTEREVTVEFLHVHRRFLSPHEAVAQIRGLVEESIVVDTWYSGPYARGCAFVEAHCPLRASSLNARGVTRIVRQSWKGTHDCDARVV